MHLNAAFRVLSKSPFRQLNAARDSCRIYLSAGKVNMRDVCLGEHRTNFTYEPQANFLEDSVFPGFVCLGQG